MNASPMNVPARRAAWKAASASQAVMAKRLLHQHVLARLGGLDRPFGVMRMRGGDIDRLDLGVGEEALGRQRRDAGKVLRQRRLPRIAGAERHQPAVPRPRDPRGEGPGDRARTR